jgi:predicted RNase H-like HicB family nuclease
MAEYFEVEGTVIGSVRSAKLEDRKVYYASWSDEDQCFIGLCQEFPSLSFCANTEDEALDGIGHLVDKAVEDMQKNGEPVPGPKSEPCWNKGLEVAVPVLITEEKELGDPDRPGRTHKYKVGFCGKEARKNTLA